MTTKEEIAIELNARILADVEHFDGDLPERYSTAWHGYIAGLYEWSLITQSDYAELFDLLPRLSEPNPVAEIFEGRGD